MKLVLRKSSAILQLLATGALTAIASNLTALPPKYQIGAIIAVGALQAVMPSPIKTATPEEKP